MTATLRILSVDGWFKVRPPKVVPGAPVRTLVSGPRRRPRQDWGCGAGRSAGAHPAGPRRSARPPTRSALYRDWASALRRSTSSALLGFTGHRPDRRPAGRARARIGLGPGARPRLWHRGRGRPAAALRVHVPSTGWTSRRRCSPWPPPRASTGRSIVADLEPAAAGAAGDVRRIGVGRDVHVTATSGPMRCRRSCGAAPWRGHRLDRRRLGAVRAARRQLGGARTSQPASRCAAAASRR